MTRLTEKIRMRFHTPTGRLTSRTNDSHRRCSDIADESEKEREDEEETEDSGWEHVSSHPGSHHYRIQQDDDGWSHLLRKPRRRTTDRVDLVEGHSEGIRDERPSKLRDQQERLAAINAANAAFWKNRE